MNLPKEWNRIDPILTLILIKQHNCYKRDKKKKISWFSSWSASLIQSGLVVVIWIERGNLIFHCRLLVFRDILVADIKVEFQLISEEID